MASDVSLVHNNVFGELAELSLESFGSGKPEPYVFDTGGSTAFADALLAPAAARGWQPLNAGELGIAPIHLASVPGELTYEFVGGLYQANVAGAPGTADALVVQGDVNGKTTVAIAFRGTDELPGGDSFDFANFNQHFAKFAAIDHALIDYVDNPTNGIDQVLVTGMSLGGAMADTFMEQDGVRGDPRYEAVTFASPGADLPSAVESGARQDVRLIDFAHNEDAVPLAHQPARELFGLSGSGNDEPSALGVLGLLTLAENPSSPELRLVAGLPPDLLLEAALHPPRTLPGGEVEVAIPPPGEMRPASGFGLAEHDPFLYAQTMNTLIDLAETPGNTFYGTPAAAAIRAQDPALNAAQNSFVSLDPNQPVPAPPPLDLASLGRVLPSLEASFASELELRGLDVQHAAQHAWNAAVAADWGVFHH